MERFEIRVTALENTNFELLRIVRDIGTGLNLMNLKIEDGFQKIDYRFQKIDERFQDIDYRFQEIDERFQNIDVRFQNIDDRFQKIDDRFQNIDERFQNIDGKLQEIEDRFQVIDIRIQKMDNRLDRKIDALRKFAIVNFKTVNTKLDDIMIELGQINEVTSYRGIFNNNLKVAKRSKID